MIWTIIEMLFLPLLIILPLTMYRTNRLFMAKFHLGMVGKMSARKLYVQCLLIFLLLYHYIYSGGHFGEWGILISTMLCAVLFSFKRADKWLHRLHGQEEIYPDRLACIGNLRHSAFVHSGGYACLSSFGCHVLSLLPCVVRMAE